MAASEPRCGRSGNAYRKRKRFHSMLTQPESIRLECTAMAIKRTSPAIPEYLPLSTAAKLCPSRPSTPTVWRWARRGVRTRDGSRVYLQVIRSGGNLYTTAEWVQTFMRALAERDRLAFAAEAEAQRVPLKSTAKKSRQKDIAAAKRRLAAKGV